LVDAVTGEVVESQDKGRGYQIGTAAISGDRHGQAVD